MGLRSRKVEIILYKENVADFEKFENYLKSTGNLYFISPLHDKDIYLTGDKKGEIKKAHWHVLLCFQNARFFNSVAKEFAEYGVIEQNLNTVKQINSAVRYLCHLDDLEKASYEINNIKTNCKDLQKYLKKREEKLTQAELSEIIIEKLNESEINCFYDIVSLAKGLGSEFLNFVIMRAYFFNRYVEDMKRYKENDKRRKENQMTKDLISLMSAEKEPPVIKKEE